MKKVLFIFLTLILLTAWSNLSHSQSLDNSYINSYKIIVNSMKKGESVGSGFVSNGYIITNRHVVAGGEMFRVIDSSGVIHETKLIHISEDYDLALLEIVDKTKTGIKLCENSNIGMGYPIYNIGNPKGELFIFTQGYISGLKRNIPFFKSGELILHNLVGTAGQSGSAIIDPKTHCVVGVVTGKMPDSYIGYSIPVESLKKYLESIDKR